MKFYFPPDLFATLSETKSQWSLGNAAAPATTLSRTLSPDPSTTLDTGLRQCTLPPPSEHTFERGRHIGLGTHESNFEPEPTVSFNIEPRSPELWLPPEIVNVVRSAPYEEDGGYDGLNLGGCSPLRYDDAGTPSNIQSNIPLWLPEYGLNQTTAGEPADLSISLRLPEYEFHQTTAGQSADLNLSLLSSSTSFSHLTPGPSDATTLQVLHPHASQSLLPTVSIPFYPNITTTLPETSSTHAEGPNQPQSVLSVKRKRPKDEVEDDQQTEPNKRKRKIRNANSLTSEVESQRKVKTLRCPDEYKFKNAAMEEKPPLPGSIPDVASSHAAGPSNSLTLKEMKARRREEWEMEMEAVLLNAEEVNGKWYCPLPCKNTGFNRELDLRRHVLQTKIHRPSDVVGAYACDRCPAIFSRKSSLKRHQDTSCCGRWDANEEQGDGVVEG